MKLIAHVCFFIARRYLIYLGKILFIILYNARCPESRNTRFRILIRTSKSLEEGGGEGVIESGNHYRP